MISGLVNGRWPSNFVVARWEIRSSPGLARWPSMNLSMYFWNSTPFSATYIWSPALRPIANGITHAWDQTRRRGMSSFGKPSIPVITRTGSGIAKSVTNSISSRPIHSSMIS